MAAAELQAPESEQQRIERWRAEELERAGYEPSAASSSPAAWTSISTARSTCCAPAALRT